MLILYRDRTYKPIGSATPQHSGCILPLGFLYTTTKTMQFSTFIYITVVQLGVDVKLIIVYAMRAMPNPNLLAVVWFSFMCISYQSHFVRDACVMELCLRICACNNNYVVLGLYLKLSYCITLTFSIYKQQSKQNCLLAYILVEILKNYWQHTHLACLNPKDLQWNLNPVHYLTKTQWISESLFRIFSFYSGYISHIVQVN